MTVPALNNLLERLLAHAEVDNPEGDAVEILMSAMDCNRTQFILRRREDLPDKIVEKAIAMAENRAAGVPLQYVLGKWSFMGREYSVGSGVLIPRDDTEVVVKAALDIIKDVHRPVIADLCSGTGIIAVTLQKKLNNATVYAVEKSSDAYAYLLRNIKDNRADIHPVKADIADCADAFANETFDMIISNPPYIRSSDIAGLQKEVLYEPRMALDGGESGYDFYEIILQKWTPKLKKGGYIALEIGEDQYEHIKSLLQKHGYTDTIGYPDIQVITRAVTAKI